MKSLFLQGFSCFAFAVTFVDAPAMALPFNSNGAAFQQYLNTAVNWGSGKKVVFSHLSGCMHPKAVVVGQGNHFDCTHGYAKIVDPVGTRTCELYKVEYHYGKVTYRCR
jgi:hypothetical protein